MTLQEALRQLVARGYRGAAFSIVHLSDLDADIEARHRDGLFDEEFYEERLASFECQPPEGLPDAKSIFAVAGPDPQVQVTFTRGGQALPVFLAATYPHREVADERVGATLAKATSVKPSPSWPQVQCPHVIE